jgi:nitric oxide reductase activation protein
MRLANCCLPLSASIHAQRRLWLILSDVPPGTAERYARVLGMAWTPVAGQAARFRGIQVLLLRRVD